MLMPSQFIVLEVVFALFIVAYLFVRLYKQFINSRKMKLVAYSSALSPTKAVSLSFHKLEKFSMRVKLQPIC